MKKITLLIALFVASFGFAQSLPYNFSTPNQLMSGGDGAATSIVKDGDNDVLQIIGAAAPYDHAIANFALNVDLSDADNNTITFKIKPVNGTGNGSHLLKFEGGTGGAANIELPFTTTGTDWQTITLDYGAGLGNYPKMVLFVDFGPDNAAFTDTYLVDDIAGAKNLTEAVEPPSLPFDFSSANQLMAGDGGSIVSIVKDGDNDVLQIVGATAPWDNAQIVLGENLDLSDNNNNTITFKIKPVNGTGSGSHLLKFEGGIGGPVNTELPFTTTGTDWQTITLDFGAGLGNYPKMVIFTDAFDANAAVSDTYLIDDIMGAKNVTGETVLPALPFNFSNANQSMYGDGGTVVSIIKDGDNDVLQIIGATAPYDNAQIVLEPVNLSNNDSNTITFKIKPVNGTGSGSHLLKFEGGTGGPANTELPFTTTGTEWQTITLDFGAGLGTYNKLVLFTDFGDANASVIDTYLVDDIALSASTGGGGGSTDEGYCEKVVTHLSIGDALIASAIKLTVANSGAKTLKVTIESNDADPVDFILIPGDVTGSPTISAADTSVAGKISVTLTWEATPPTDVVFNLLWSKVSTDGNWQLGDAPTSFKFAATCSTASVSNNVLASISMYPNPTSSKLNISAVKTIKNVEIYNVLGKKVMNLNVNETSKSIDVSNLATGVYLIKYQVENTVGTAKFIKQ